MAQSHRPSDIVTPQLLRRVSLQGPVMRVIIFSLVLFLGGCDWDGDCISLGRPSQRVTIRDSQTGALVATGAIVLVIGQDFRDSVQIQENIPNQTVAFERDGPVTIEVRQVGYELWTRSGVVAVRHGSCDYIRATDITALLIPSKP